MGEGHSISEDQIYWLPEIELDLEPIKTEDWILDIGGGGEGVIGQLAGKQVVAIDSSERELRQAPDGPLKIIMDATHLDFLDDSFQTITCFYSLMYMSVEVQEEVFGEIARVLKPGGRCLVWDYIIPAQGEREKMIAAFKLSVRMKDRVIDTGYGTRWPAVDLDAEHYVSLANSAGLDVVKKILRPPTFYLELIKPMQ